MKLKYCLTFCEEPQRCGFGAIIMSVSHDQFNAIGAENIRVLFKS